MTLVDTFAAAKVPVAIYCRLRPQSPFHDHKTFSNLTAIRSWQFPDFFGANFTSLSHLPLIYAHYDNIPSYVDIAGRVRGLDVGLGARDVEVAHLAAETLFGGWASASGKQVLVHREIVNDLFGSCLLRFSSSTARGTSR
jgi:hypothetical protein